MRQIESGFGEREEKKRKIGKNTLEINIWLRPQVVVSRLPDIAAHSYKLPEFYIRPVNKLVNFGAVRAYMQL